MSFSLSPLIVNVISSSFSLFSSLSVYISLYKYVCSNFSIHLLRLVVSFLENDCIDSRNVENKMIFKVAVIFQFILKLLPLNKSNVSVFICRFRSAYLDTQPREKLKQQYLNQFSTLHASLSPDLNKKSSFQIWQR